MKNDRMKWCLDPGRRTFALAAGLGLVALGAAAGCGEATELEARTGALKDPSHPNNPQLPLGAGWSRVPSLPALNPATGEPTLLAADNHIVATFVQAGSFGYWAGAGESVQEVSWAQYSPDVFATAPAVARLPSVHFTDGSQEEHMLLVGRGGSDKRMFWSEGVIGAASAGVFPPPQPVTVPAFAAINGNTFNDPYGYPALTSNSTDNTIIMAYIGLNTSNQATVYAQLYNPAVSDPTRRWKPRVAAPALPTGWTPVGRPAIAWGYQNLTTIVVKARNGSSTGLFRIFFTGTNFFDTLGTPQFRRLTPPGTPPSIDSNPAMEYDGSIGPDGNQGALTLYYRSGSGSNNIYEASFADTSFFEGFKQLTGSPGQAFAGDPSVYGGINLENTEHWIMGRDASFNMYVGFTVTDLSLAP